MEVRVVEQIDMPPKQPRTSYEQPKRSKDAGRVAVVAYVNKQVRDDLKRMAIDRGTTVQEVVETMLEREIASHQQAKKLSQ